MAHMGAGEVRTDFWWGDLIARDLGVDGKIKMDGDGMERHGLHCSG